MKVQKYLLVLVSTLLGVLVGAAIGGFTLFFALLSLHQSGLLKAKEFTVWPDYLFLVLGIFLGSIILGVITWRSFKRD